MQGCTSLSGSAMWRTRSYGFAKSGPLKFLMISHCLQSLLLYRLECCSRQFQSERTTWSSDSFLQRITDACDDTDGFLGTLSPKICYRGVASLPLGIQLISSLRCCCDRWWRQKHWLGLGWQCCSQGTVDDSWFVKWVGKQDQVWMNSMTSDHCKWTRENWNGVSKESWPLGWLWLTRPSPVIRRCAPVTKICKPWPSNQCRRPLSFPS